MIPKFNYIGELPRGEWKFGLVSIVGNTDVIVAVEKNGKEPPRMIIDGKLVNVEPVWVYE